jgi:hypothetical protein
MPISLLCNWWVCLCPWELCDLLGYRDFLHSVPQCLGVGEATQWTLVGWMGRWIGGWVGREMIMDRQMVGWMND